MATGHRLHCLAWLPPVGIAALVVASASVGCTSDRLARGTHKIHVNHIGYDRGAPKRAVVEANDILDTFQVIDARSGKVALDGRLKKIDFFDEWGGGPAFYVADFSALDRPGTYALRIKGEVSPAFAVEERLLFTRTAAAVVRYFHAMRADESDAAIWRRDAAVPIFGTSETHDVRGGWYDASGDVSKYLTHLSYANFLNTQHIPLVAWALAWTYDTASQRPGARALLSEIQDEALWGADFLVRDQDKDGFFYATVFDGWSGRPERRQICAFSGTGGEPNGNFRAAFREGGGMAIAALARIAGWKKDSAYFPAARYLQAAERGFEHLEAKNLEYVDDGKENVIDDYTALLAASELFATTRRPEYLEAARARARSLVARVHSSGYFIADDGQRPFWHASDAGLPVVALVRYAEVEEDDARRQAVRAAVRKHLDHLVALTNAVPNPYGYARQQIAPDRSAFFVPHDNESGYWWQGEDARLASLTSAALMGGTMSAATAGEPLGVSRELSELAVDQLDWVLGKNPYDACMLAGFGRNNPEPYALSKPEGGTLAGGIANGITSRERDGQGIQWGTRFGGWRNWRWVEQWLPHTAWYLVAVTALAEAEER